VEGVARRRLLNLRQVGAGHRHGHRERQLMGTFGPVTVRVPRAQKVLLAVKNTGGESEAAWRALLDDLVKRGLKMRQCRWRARPRESSCGALERHAGPALHDA
jgi:hypothetical protein